MSSPSVFAAKEVAELNSDEVKSMKLPRSIGHRGYPVKYPENSLESLLAAIDVGADGIETDVHLSADGYVVVSHDLHTKRVFGSTTEPIRNRNYIGDLEHLRTVQEPHSKMVLLKEVLDQFVTNPKFEGKWLCIDVKADNDVAVIEGIAKVMMEVMADPLFWKERVVLGIWLVKFLPLCHKHVPEIPLIHIGVDLSYAANFIHEPSVIGISMVMVSIYTQRGYDLITQLHDLGKFIYVWTVNPPELMTLCIALGVDAVLTDEPVKFEQCRVDALAKAGESRDALGEAERAISFGTKTRLYGLSTGIKVLAPLLRRRFE
ncbi:PLC-like phosphodiesterase [Myxozyma melibiosi]|uniref:PLC-like phosphodiesterase n=1 Tax=Myxozyma melibiosi TaxID=54550 RepID=A0ABR1F954_9ASCO